jgi:hypothetical protein
LGLELQKYLSLLPRVRDQQNVKSKPDIFSMGSEDPETGDEYESLMTDLSP